MKTKGKQRGAGSRSAGKPAAGRPVAKKPSAGRPSARKPTARRPSAGRPSAGKPSSGRPPAGKPARPAASRRRPADPVARGDLMADSVAATSVLDLVKYDERGLVPVVAQEEDGTVLMLAWANLEALTETLTTGRGTYWSRSRQELWRKGDTSGHRQEVSRIAVDCDGDAVLYTLRQTGPACHTGTRSCFFTSQEI